jgi:hypothetical protein
VQPQGVSWLLLPESASHRLEASQVKELGSAARRSRRVMLALAKPLVLVLVSAQRLELAEVWQGPLLVSGSVRHRLARV